MPGGGGDYFDSRSMVSAGAGGVSAAAASALSQHGFADELKPLDRRVTTDAKSPIVIALDISGSMSDWPKIFYDKIPMFYGTLCAQSYVPDPALSFSAFAGTKPLQASDFARGNDIDTQLTKLYLAGGGGAGETYADTAYFYGGENVQTPSAEGKPFFFFTGDEYNMEMHENLVKQYLDSAGRMFGVGQRRKIKVTIPEGANANLKATLKDGAEFLVPVPQGASPGDVCVVDAEWAGTWSPKLIWRSLMTKFHVFHLRKPGTPRQHWDDILGADRVLMLQTPKAVCDVTLGAIAITSGARTMAEYMEDMKERGQDAARMKEVAAALAGVPKLKDPADGGSDRDQLRVWMDAEGVWEPADVENVVTPADLD